MPATYNDAIEAAIIVVVKEWKAQADPEPVMKLMLSIVGKLTDLKRRPRRVRQLLHRTTAPGT